MEASAESGEFESTKFDVLGLNDFSREPFRVVGRVRVDDGSRLCPENDWGFCGTRKTTQIQSAIRPCVHIAWILKRRVVNASSKHDMVAPLKRNTSNVWIGLIIGPNKWQVAGKRLIRRAWVGVITIDWIDKE